MAVPTNPKKTAAPVAFITPIFINGRLKYPVKISAIKAGIAFNERAMAAIYKEGMCSKFLDTILTLKP